MAAATPERRSIWRVGSESTWTTVVPVVFIIASLLSLVILPIVFSVHTARMRREITRVAEPARLAANRIQMDLSAEVDRLMAFQATEQKQYRDAYLQKIEEQRHDYNTLRSLGPQLGVDVGQKLNRLVKEGSEWHEGVQRDEFISRKLPAEVFMSRMFQEHPQYEQSLQASNELETAIQASIDERLSRIRSTERLNVSLTLVLALLALTSALLVAGLGRQMRLLAREAMRRRQEAEREASDAKLARAAAEREELRAAFLASAGQELTASLDFKHAVTALARLVVPNLAEMCGIDLLESDGSLHRVATVRRDATNVSDPVTDSTMLVEDIPDVLVSVMRERQARVIGPSPALVRYLGGSEEDQPLSTMAVPLVSRGQTLGVITAAAAPGKTFTRDDALLAAELARRGSLAIDNARLYEESQQALRAREEVLAIVSHDLRNPLNSITLAVSLLETSLPAEDREQLDAIDVSAQRMKRLIDDLLDVTRLEGGKRLPIEPAPMEVEALFTETYELFKAQAATSSITLRYRVADGVPPVHADHHRVLQVLSNLIGNAIKFTPAGGVVSYAAEPRRAEVLFTISDTGPGIPREHLGDIFNPYWQAKRTERLGAGLGLPIAKGIVESHGGKIWVDSRDGGGTKFYFTLPAHVTSAAESPAHR